MLCLLSQKRSKWLFAHRPKQSEAVSAEEIAQQWKSPYTICGSDTEIPNECDIYLITGCGIVSKECLKGKKIRSTHTGIILNSRGLDSCKWVSLEHMPSGVTLHYIDEKVDCGAIVSVSPTPIYSSDTLHTLARRHYENEIAMLSNFALHLSKPQNPFAGILQTKSTKRM